MAVDPGLYVIGELNVVRDGWQLSDLCLVSKTPKLHDPGFDSHHLQCCEPHQ